MKFLPLLLSMMLVGGVANAYNQEQAQDWCDKGYGCEKIIASELHEIKELLKSRI